MPLIVRMRVDDREVQRGLDAMRERGSRLHQVFRALGKELRKELKEAGAREAGPEGSWRRLAPSTTARDAHARTFVKRQRRRRKKGDLVAGPLRETRAIRVRTGNILGSLPKSVRATARPRSLVAQSAVRWGGVQNEGGTVGRGAVIPARPFVFLSEPFLERAEAVFGDFIAEAWEREAP